MTQRRRDREGSKSSGGNILTFVFTACWKWSLLRRSSGLCMYILNCTYRSTLSSEEIFMCTSKEAQDFAKSNSSWIVKISDGCHSFLSLNCISGGDNKETNGDVNSVSTKTARFSVLVHAVTSGPQIHCRAKVWSFRNNSNDDESHSKTCPGSYQHSNSLIFLLILNLSTIR